MCRMSAHTIFSYNSTLLTHLCSKIAPEGRKKFLLFFNNFWKIIISEICRNASNFPTCSDIMIFQNLLKIRRSFLRPSRAIFWEQMGRKCRVVGKNSMCGHPGQFAKHLNVVNFRRFFMSFENYLNISIFQREL